MSNPIKELDGQMARHVLAQFLGENIGELKTLDSNIIQGNNTLKGNTLNINQLGHDIPGNPPQPEYRAPIPSQPAPPSVTQQQIFELPTQIVVQEVVKPKSDQFEFKFDISSSDIFNRIDTIERQNKEILTLLKELSNKDTKKKN